MKIPNRKPSDLIPAVAALCVLLALIYGLVSWRVSGPEQYEKVFSTALLLRSGGLVLIAGILLLRYVVRKRRWKKTEAESTDDPAMQEALRTAELRRMGLWRALWLTVGGFWLLLAVFDVCRGLVNNMVYDLLIAMVFFGAALYYHRELQAARGPRETAVSEEGREKRRRIALICAALVCVSAVVLWLAAGPRRHVAAVRALEWEPTTLIQVDYDGERPTRTVTVDDRETQMRIYAALKNLTYEGRTDKDFYAMPEDMAYEIRIRGMLIKQGRVEYQWIHLRLLTAEPEPYDKRPRYTLDYDGGDIVVGGVEELLQVVRELLEEP